MTAENNNPEFVVSRPVLHVWRRNKVAIRCVGSMILLSLLIWRCDWAALWIICQEAKTVWWIPAVGLLACYFVLGWWSLKALMIDKPSLGWVRPLVDYGVVQAFSVFTPGRSGELALAVTLRNTDVSAASLTAALVFQRLVAVALILAIGVICSFFVSADLAQISTHLVVGFLVIAGIVVAGLLAVKALKPTLPRFMRALADEGVKIQHRKAAIAIHVTIMLIRHLAISGTGYCFLISLDSSVSFAAWLAVSSVAMLATMLPITIWGLGITESVYMFGMLTVGEEQNTGLAVALLGRGTHLIVLMCWLVLSVIMQRYEHRQNHERSMHIQPER